MRKSNFRQFPGYNSEDAWQVNEERVDYSTPASSVSSSCSGTPAVQIVQDGSSLTWEDLFQGQREFRIQNCLCVEINLLGFILKELPDFSVRPKVYLKNSSILYQYEKGMAYAINFIYLDKDEELSKVLEN